MSATYKVTVIGHNTKTHKTTEVRNARTVHVNAAEDRVYSVTADRIEATSYNQLHFRVADTIVASFPIARTIVMLQQGDK